MKPAWTLLSTPTRQCTTDDRVVVLDEANGRVVRIGTALELVMDGAADPVAYLVRRRHGGNAHLHELGPDLRGRELQRQARNHGLHLRRHDFRAVVPACVLLAVVHGDEDHCSIVKEPEAPVALRLGAGAGVAPLATARASATLLLLLAAAVHRGADLSFNWLTQSSTPRHQSRIEDTTAWQ